MTTGARWVTACALAEAVGLGAAATASRAADTGDGTTTGAGTALALALVVAGGLVEGTALGTAQAWALGPRLDRRGRARWVAGTVVVAGLGWAGASVPVVLTRGDDTGGGPSGLLAVLLAATLGAAMGTLLGVAQAWAWSGRVRHPARWVLGTALGWTAAMPVVFAGAGLPSSSWSLGAVAATGAATGLVAGAVLGLVTGVFLLALDGPRLRHRLVLAVLDSPLVHPADRDGDGSLVGLAVTGARTGRRFRFPVSAARPAPDRLVVLPGHPTRKTWWRNLRTRPEVEVLVDGAWTPGRARVLRCGEPGWDAARSAYAARYPRVRTSGEPFVVVDLATRDFRPSRPGPGAVGGGRGRS